MMIVGTTDTDTDEWNGYPELQWMISILSIDISLGRFSSDATDSDSENLNDSVCVSLNSHVILFSSPPCWEWSQFKRDRQELCHQRPDANYHPHGLQHERRAWRGVWNHSSHGRVTTFGSPRSHDQDDQGLECLFCVSLYNDGQGSDDVGCPVKLLVVLRRWFNVNKNH